MFECWFECLSVLRDVFVVLLPWCFCMCDIVCGCFVIVFVVALRVIAFWCVCFCVCDCFLLFAIGCSCALVGWLIACLSCVRYVVF